MTGPNEPRSDQPRLAGGVFIAIGALSGAIGGAANNGLAVQGFLIGTGAGIAIAALIWLLDRRRSS